MSEERPLIPGKIIGYRAWKIDGGLLRPIAAMAVPWTPGVNTAQCSILAGASAAIHRALRELHGADGERFNHEVPDHGCHCGLHAYNLGAPAVSEVYRWDSIVGVVAAWGNAEVHSNGFRAEHAEILALKEPDRSGIKGRKLKKLGRHYGVPIVKTLEALETIGAEVGKPVTESLEPVPDPVGRLVMDRRAYEQWKAGQVNVEFQHGQALPLPPSHTIHSDEEGDE